MQKELLSPPQPGGDTEAPRHGGECEGRHRGRQHGPRGRRHGTVTLSDTEPHAAQQLPLICPSRSFQDADD